MPHFSRSQLGVILLLGAALLFIWGWRGNFGLPLRAPQTPPLHPVFVEVTGAGARSGVYTFPAPPTLATVLSQAGGVAPPGQKDSNLASGSKVEITSEGPCRLGRMDGSRLLTLGLALDLNNANAADLEALPGIGPVLAQRILDFRQAHGPFKGIDDLEQVSGIGPKKLAQVKPFIFINDHKND